MQNYQRGLISLYPVFPITKELQHNITTRKPMPVQPQTPFPIPSSHFVLYTHLCTYQFSVVPSYMQTCEYMHICRSGRRQDTERSRTTENFPLWPCPSPFAPTPFWPLPSTNLFSIGLLYNWKTNGMWSLGTGFFHIQHDVLKIHPTCRYEWFIPFDYHVAFWDIDVSQIFFWTVRI